jgi:glycosyltransferase involved in cell wall biosynthesis
VRILFVDLEIEWRGGQNQAFLLLKSLNARGDTAELVAVKGSAIGKRAAAKRVRVHWVPRHGARLVAAAKIMQLTRGAAFDIVHANEPHAVTAVWLARAHTRSAFVISRRVGYPLSRNGMALARYRAAARIIAISQWVAEQLAVSGMPREKLTVVYEGVDLPALPVADVRQRSRARWKVPEDSPLLGSVGVLSPDKGHDLLLRSLAQLRDEFPAVRLVLAGDGPAREELQQLATQLGVSDRVLFLGFVQDIDAVYPALDAFLFPSFFEGLGTSLLAAMSYEIPSVTFRGCAFGEIIENEKSGLLVETGKLGELTASTRRLLKDREMARRMGQAGRARIAEKFSSERMVSETIKIYEELCSSADV